MATGLLPVFLTIGSFTGFRHVNIFPSCHCPLLLMCQFLTGLYHSFLNGQCFSNVYREGSWPYKLIYHWETFPSYWSYCNQYPFLSKPIYLLPTVLPSFTGTSLSMYFWSSPTAVFGKGSVDSSELYAD